MQPLFIFSVLSICLSVILSNFDINLQPKFGNETKGNAIRVTPFIWYNEFACFLLGSHRVSRTVAFFILWNMFCFANDFTPHSPYRQRQKGYSFSKSDNLGQNLLSNDHLFRMLLSDGSPLRTPQITV
jgi:hypothetical protein